MKLFLPALEVGPLEGFTPDKDIFNRKIVGDGLTNLVTTVDQPLVIALDGQWGSGKSTFLRMWAGELRKIGIGVVHFDAFESDYLDDAFTAIAGQIISLAQEKHKEQDGKVKVFIDKAFDASKVIARSLMKVGLKLGTAGALDAGDLTSISKEVGNEVGALGDKYLGEALTRQREQKAVIVEFREALSALPTLLSPMPDSDEGRLQPLIIIIDELDRCRPSFALEVLERAKHFFSVPNVHFVLGVHLGQLENSVKATYGSDVDARMYLQKFISLPVMLSDRKKEASDYSTMRYARWLANAYEIEPQSAEIYAELIGSVAVARGLSLRTMERIFSNVALTLAFSSRSTFRPSILVSGLCILRVTNPDLFILAKTGNLRYDQVNVALAFDKLPGLIQDGRFRRIRELWMYATDAAISDEIAERVESTYSNHNIPSRDFMIMHVSGSVMDRFVS